MMGPAEEPMLEVPPTLVDEIDRGNCVAFVGAGFSAAAGLPSWRALLKSLAQTEGMDAETRVYVLGLVDDPGVLRDERPRWWQRAFWDAHPTGAPTLHLHGDLRSPAAAARIVFTREDYRRRLYGDPAYVTFLRSVFSTSTVLYLGFSFMDAYLNELRSEILALLGYAPHDRPVAYAILNDVSPATRGHFRRHEGVEVLGFDSRDPPGFVGFDRWLAAIHAATCPMSRFGAILAGKRILWMDPNRDNNTYGVQFLERAAGSHNRRLAPIVMADSPGEALALLGEAQRAESPFDLTISYWGREDEDGVTPGGKILQGMRAADLRCPVLIFAGTHDAEDRKRAALRLGAQAYCILFESLFRQIEEIFAPVEETW